MSNAKARRATTLTSWNSCGTSLRLLGFHSNALVMTQLARSLGDGGMTLAYVESIERKEREQRIELLMHQKWSGAKLIESMVNVASGGVSSMAARGCLGIEERDARWMQAKETARESKRYVTRRNCN